jgi:hypothetical protein
MVAAPTLNKGNRTMNTATLLKAFVDVADYRNPRQAFDNLKELQAEIAKLVDKYKAEALDLGMAEMVLTQRENAPSKAAYVKIHGQAAFDQNKTISDVRTFTWIK